MKSAIGTASLGVSIFLSACAPQAQTPEKICSDSKTYDNMTEILSEQISQASASSGPDAIAASSKSAIARVLKYLLPTVESVNKDTKKIECKAILRVSIPAKWQAMTDTSALQINEVAADHVSIRISYSVQPSADGSTDVVTMENATPISIFALQASLAAIMQIRGVSGTLPLQEPDATNNLIDGPSNEPSASPSPLATPEDLLDGEHGEDVRSPMGNDEGKIPQ
ncbi:hypothetical protein [Sphingomonas sp. BE137]|uniref:hypothetical protein n=1 Tax=Sphingomonas sp. BE137 TaxID=2817844 RepID=UPI001AE2617B|nr:hypothetical protein [Sphingomonas sp. BE137]MDR6850330.1 hypothetical protein [Sphingomonas sp. BE137]